MPAKMLIEIPTMNWAYTVILEEDKEYSFGSSRTNSFPLPPGTAAPKHTSIVFRSAWMAEDCGSEEGTLVNGARISSYPLKHQDVLRIGTCEAVFQNPQDAAKAEVGHTQKIAEQHQSSLQSFVKKAESSGLQYEKLDAMFTGPGEGKPSVESAPAGSRLEQLQAEGSADLMWVAQKLSFIMSAVLFQKATRDETYKLMLEHLKQSIRADNGFLMIPEVGEKTRWVIRAWVGDVATWTPYEKQHPISLTVTNRAYNTKSVVSNALPNSSPDEESINSASLQALKVNSYIAMPIIRDQSCNGVLYFDTRNKGQKFMPRDIKLLELVGACIFDIEDLRR